VSQLGLITGASRILELEIVMLPLDSNVSITPEKIIKLSYGVMGTNSTGTFSRARYSASGQSAGKVLRNSRVELLKLARNDAGNFSNPGIL
jgi:hypothetical protein